MCIVNQKRVLMKNNVLFKTNGNVCAVKCQTLKLLHCQDMHLHDAFELKATVRLLIEMIAGCNE